MGSYPPLLVRPRKLFRAQKPRSRKPLLRCVFLTDIAPPTISLTDQHLLPRLLSLLPPESPPEPPDPPDLPDPLPHINIFSDVSHAQPHLSTFLISFSSGEALSPSQHPPCFVQWLSSSPTD
ncbi:hypothetical protein AXX17_AT5G32390 [Arabidopsis thaliana]|uniref:Uncharacterized protein n=1 Tax=Arabidopsis thaliana TaxID=3702 RepID=A0A178UMU8_ARATH|nr:hypothetical protein AXX17_AT5G32390 [Arabidopsis thaliana]